jgi:hypothetical protein
MKDLTTEELFDLELLALRAGAAPLASTIRSAEDRAYLLGIVAAAQRNPGPMTQLMSSWPRNADGTIAVPTLGPGSDGDPLGVENRARLQALLLNRAIMRQREARVAMEKRGLSSDSRGAAGSVEPRPGLDQGMGSEDESGEGV